jgi:hypothetical protein
MVIEPLSNSFIRIFVKFRIEHYEILICRFVYLININFL